MPWDLKGNKGTDPTSDFLGTSDSRPLAIRTNGSEKLRVTPDGRVGIGTTTPIAPLHIPEGGLQIGFSDTASDNFHLTSGPVDGVRGLRIWNKNYGSGMHILTALANGNVGIGVFVPARPLHISTAGNDVLMLQSFAGGANNTVNLDFQTYATIDQTYPTASVRAIDDGSYSSHLALLTKDSGANANALSERMRISSNGNVGIGTTTPRYPLDVEAGWAILGLDTREANQDAGIRLHENGAVKWHIFNDASAGSPLVIGSDVALGLHIQQNGNVGVGTDVPGAKLGVNGDIEVTGDIRLKGADCAEDFDASEAGGIEPGAVVVIDEGGKLKQSDRAYDKRVAGVVSGAGDYRPGLVLDKQDASESGTEEANRVSIALMGKVYCKVDARRSPVEVGDLLTTSPTPGHAMRVATVGDTSGAVIGKALQGLNSGRDLVPILVSLQ